MATSKFGDLAEGTRFSPVLKDIADGIETRKLILCSGKIFYDLHKERANKGLEQSVGIVRVEELSPFPFEALRETLFDVPALKEVAWVQEESRNQGAWPHVEPRLRVLLEEISSKATIKYWGRREDAVPAVGVSKIYKEQQGKVISGAFA